MTTQADFFQEHAIDGELTDAQMLQMIHLPEGDTSALLDGGMPDAAAGKEVTPDDVQSKQTASEATPELEPTNQVVLAKDGVHHIPYDKLVEARNSSKHWQAQAEAAQHELDALKAQAQARADNGNAPTRTDNMVAAAEAAIESGVDVSLFGDFSEEALAAGIKQLVSAQVQTEVSKATEHLRKQEQQAATDGHYGAILSAHPDAGSIVQSAQLDAWIKSQPSYAQPALRHVLEDGETSQVIELLDNFKSAHGKTQQPAAQGKPDVAAAAKAAIASAKSQVPTSLSEIPAGSKAHHDEAQALMEMSDGNTLSSFMGKSPEQIRALLERAL